MSTLRYCGSLRIRITYLEFTQTSPPPAGYSNAWPHGEYRCHVRASRDEAKTVYVGAVLEHGSGICVDSPEAFDSVAHAAVSFADHEGLCVDGAWPKDDGSGWRISRRPEVTQSIGAPCAGRR